MEHLSTETIEALVMGVESADSEAIRRHVTQCASCAGRLRREAQLEMLLHAAAGASDDATSAARRPLWLRWRVPLQAAAVLLILAGGALWLRSARRPREASGLHSAGPTEPTETTYGTASPGWDVDSPRDHGQRVVPSIPCLESSTVRRPGENDPA